MATTQWEPVIGLEIHVQPKTASKMFCRCENRYGAPPNTLVCPVCLGLPGALPVVNRQGVELGLRAALALQCTIHETSIFARKNYVYPDLPKGYQITQFDRPIATGGKVDVVMEDGSVMTVRIHRVHLEEDAGKSMHDRFPGSTAVDLNRAGVPLAEIVTEADIRSAAQAKAFLTVLKQQLQYAEVSECNMEEGSLRVDANVSVRPVGQTSFGTKTEVKNMNSFSNVEHAIEFEVARQIALLESGGVVKGATMLWDAAKGEARAQRSKEESPDYRYFADPDLLPLVVSPEWVDSVRKALPESPSARRARFEKEYLLPAYDAGVLTASREVAAWFEELARIVGDGKLASNWVMGEVTASLNASGGSIESFPLKPVALGELLILVKNGTISNSTARAVFATMIATGRGAGDIVAAQELASVRDDGALDQWVAEVANENPAEAERLRNGEEKLIGLVVGKVMKKSGGKADPKGVNEAVRRHFKLAGK